MLNLDALEARIDRTLLVDRHKLLRRLRDLSEGAPRGQFDFGNRLNELALAVDASQAKFSARLASFPAITYPAELPICQRLQELRSAIADHPVVIVQGATGSGKSTQLPKICLELGLGAAGMIGHTQPRRLTARALATRIAAEFGQSVGGSGIVGYKVRFTDQTRPGTVIKLMTDGILLAESQQDRFLNAYEAIIVDEAHERSLNIDFLLLLLRRLLARRSDLKVIVTSATLDAERMQHYFSEAGIFAPVVVVEGRSYPVQVRYQPVPRELDDSDDPLARHIIQVARGLLAEDPGGILVFLPTEGDILRVAKRLRASLAANDEVEVLPLYARLAAIEQNRIFQPSQKPRIVLATNVAESSLTAPGIRHVIDTGMARISRYSSRARLQRLPIEAISKAAADQRKGRCGRQYPGICVRLFSEEDFSRRLEHTPPEMLRSDLAAVALQAQVLGLGPLETCPFLDPPREEAVRAGCQTLRELGAFDEANKLTPVGRKLAKLPVDPRIGRLVLAAESEGCLGEMLIIAAALDTQDPRERPKDQEELASEVHARTSDSQSDFVSFLKLWAFVQGLRESLTRSRFQAALAENFLSHARVREWMEVHRQLCKLCEQHGMRANRADLGRIPYDALHRALIAGLLSRLAHRLERSTYEIAGGGRAKLWPGSSLLAAPPKWVVCAEVLETTQRFIRLVGRIERAWVEPLAQHHIHWTHNDPFWSRQGAEAKTHQNGSLFGLRLVHQRIKSLASVDAVEARRWFIERALVAGDFDSQASFLAFNKRVMEECRSLEKKARRDFAVDSEALYDFYDKKIPGNVHNGRLFEAWRREAEAKNKNLLRLRHSDLLPAEALALSTKDYPDSMVVGSERFPLSYHFAPGAEEDGLTLTVPERAVPSLDGHRLRWLIRGWLPELVASLIRTLPKEQRRLFSPAAKTAANASAVIRHGEGDMCWSVAKALEQVRGEPLAPQDFDPKKLPSHLRVRIRVVDEAGRVLKVGRDVSSLRGPEIQESELQSLADAGRWHRQNLTHWNWGDFPKQIPLRVENRVEFRYPSLRDCLHHVEMRLVQSEAEAERETRRGLRRLIYLAHAESLKAHVAWLPNRVDLEAWSKPLFDTATLDRVVLELIIDQAWLSEAPLPRTQHDFAMCMQAGEAQIPVAVQDVLELVSPIFSRLSRLDRGLHAKSGAAVNYAVSDLRSQWRGFASADFFLHTLWQRLVETPRYLLGMLKRLERLNQGHEAEDRARMEGFYPIWQEYQSWLQLPGAKHRYDSELEKYRWLLEEHRLALFTPELAVEPLVTLNDLENQRRNISLLAFSRTVKEDAHSPSSAATPG